MDHTYPNGDRIHNVVAVYEALTVEDEPRPDGDECTELRYFPFAALPEMSDAARRMLVQALEARRQKAAG